MAELNLWKKAGVKPAGAWYRVYEKGSQGNVPTLRYTDEKGAYTVIDRATLLTMRNEVKLVIMVEKCPDLLNYISLIPVSPKKFPKARYDDAMVFVKWLTSPDKGQKVIRDFGRETYGRRFSSRIRGSGAPCRTGSQYHTRRPTEICVSRNSLTKIRAFIDVIRNERR